MTRLTKQRVVILAAAGVLALAATLKLLAVATDPMWREVAVIPPELYLFAAMSELTIAAILFRGALARLQTPDSAWLLAVVVFAVLFLIATGLSLSGHSRCDCFGGWAASPIVALILDGSLLSLLWLTDHFPLLTHCKRRCAR